MAASAKPNLFLRRPVLSAVISILITLVGALAMKALPIAQYPDLVPPTVNVSVSYPGASAETIAATVLAPLEVNINGVENMLYMTSTAASGSGSGSINVYFSLGTNPDMALVNVNNKVNLAQTLLPEEVRRQGVTVVKRSPAMLQAFAYYSPDGRYDEVYIHNWMQINVVDELKRVPGVGDCSVFGSMSYSMRIWLQPDKLAKYGLTVGEVAQAIQDQNSQYAPGRLGDMPSPSSTQLTWQIDTEGRLVTPEQFGEIIVRTGEDSAMLRLKDVARVELGGQDYSVGSRYNGMAARMGAVYLLPGANAIATGDLVLARLEEIAKTLPDGMAYKVVVDTNDFVMESIKEVISTLVEAMILVFIVVYVFLQNWRATLIPCIAVPVSIIGTFAGMYALGYSINTLTLFGMVLAIGIVVDDAIVVLENIVRRLEMGESPLRAALRGAREVGFTVVSISISLVAVFTPILFMGGIVGRLFREFSVVLTTAVLVSMLVSLTTTPMMCAKLLRPFDADLARRKERLLQARGGFLKPLRQWCTRVGQAWGAMLAGMQRGYAASLAVVLRHPRLTMLSLLLIIAGNVWLYIIVPKGFFPQQDTGVIMGGIRADQSASFQAMQTKLAKLVDVIRADPAVEQVSAHISGGRGGGGVFISLKPLEERKIGAQAVIGRLRGKLSSEPGLQIFLQPAQDIMMGGRSARSQYQYTLQADNLDDLRTWGRRLQQALAALPLFKDVDSDIEERGLQTMLTVNRDALARLGLTMRDVDAALNNAFGQRQVSTIYQDKNQYRVVLEYGPDWLEGAQALDKVRLPGKDGLVPLLSVAGVGPAFAPLSVAHQGQFAAVTISFNLAQGASLSQAQAAIAEARVKIGMPSTIVGSFQGTAKIFSDTMSSQIILILAALAALYIVLGVLYESLIHPLTILSTIPSAGGGALLALMLFKMEFSVIALIGVLLLAGIVKKNAIMMIDFALEASRTRHLPPDKAIYEACLLRFRPIMMTTAAAILGAVPLAMGQGDGAEIRQPLGITIVGGLLVSQLLTLYTTPVVYLCLDRARLRARRFWWRLRYGNARAARLALLSRRS